MYTPVKTLGVREEETSSESLSFILIFLGRLGKRSNGWIVSHFNDQQDNEAPEIF
jgi:hypothetical protein